MAAGHPPMTLPWVSPPSCLSCWDYLVQRWPVFLLSFRIPFVPEAGGKLTLGSFGMCLSPECVGICFS